MSSGISVSLDNPYDHVVIPRAKLRADGGPVTGGNGAMVIGNPTALGIYGGGGGAGANLDEANGHAQQQSSAPPPPYMVKEDGGEEVGRCHVCCYRCRTK